MRYRLRRIRKPQIFAILMIGSLVLLVLPRRITAPIRNLVHLVAYGPQLAATRGAQTLGSEVKEFATPPVPAEEHERLRRQNLALTHEMVSLRAQVAELQATVRSLGRLRELGLRDGTLMPVSVLALDAAGGRESLLLGKGYIAGIRRDDWVASRLLIHGGSEDGLQSQSAVLAHECLIGWVEDVGSLTSRVVLLSDPVANRDMSVRIEPVGKGRRHLWENGKYVTFPLEGIGQGRMRLLDIFREYYEKELIRVGDLVVSQPGPRLPVPLVIGRIESFEHVRSKPIYYHATVAPLFDPKSLEQVYVLDLSRPAEATR